MLRKQRVTMKTIAEEAGVSISTVSRVLSGQAAKYRISKRAQDAVVEAAERLDFAPNELARGLRLSKTFTLGLVVPDISNHFFSDIARHVATEARERGYSVILCDSEDDTAIEKQELNLLQSRRVDGLIIAPVGRSGEDVMAARQKGTPVVLVDRVFPDVDVPYVTSDNHKGAYEATKYLLEQGHRSIAFIQGIPDSWTSITRCRGYEAALMEYGIPNDKKLVQGTDFGEESGYLAGKWLLERKTPPTAIFAAGNMMSLGLLRAVAEKKLRVPEDVSIISFDDYPYYPYLATPMTTVAQQTSQMGKMAVELLAGQIEGRVQYSSESILAPTKLVLRKSVRTLD